MDEQIDRAYYSESQNEVLVAQLAAVEAEVKELRAVPAKIVSCDVAQHADATCPWMVEDVERCDHVCLRNTVDVELQQICRRCRTV